jgi:tRNA threonylcarbamoyladenosine modification (KEOPS) complex  Pcc1 subunit
VLKPRNCAASIQLSFGKKGRKLIRKRKRNSGSPNSNFVSSKLCSHGHKLEHSMPSDAHFVRSIYMAIKPPITYSPQSSSLPSSRTSFNSLIHRSIPLGTNSSNIDVDTRVSYDDRSNVYIEIESYNISSLRASINSYLRLTYAAYRCIVDGDSE